MSDTGPFDLVVEDAWVECPELECDLFSCPVCGGSGKVPNPEVMQAWAKYLDGSEQKRMDTARFLLEILGDTE